MGKPATPRRPSIWLTSLSLLMALLVGGCAQRASPAAEGVTSALQGPLEAVARELDIVTGQTLYVPAYSEIHDADESRTQDLTVMLSIRNTDPVAPIYLEVLEYYDTNGRLVRKYVDEPMALPPMATSGVVISRMDREGGTGANFILVWGAEAPVYAPVVEALMTSTSQQQGLSFLTQARVLETRP